MLTQRIFSNSKSNKDINDNSEDEQIKKIIKEINKENKYNSMNKHKSQNKIRSIKRNRNSLSSTTMGTTFKKSFKDKHLENSLSYKLKDKITKERLILELRQELKYHIKFNSIYKSFLKKIIHLKEIVKDNRDKVQQNTDLLKETFKVQYNMILNYEKDIISLGIKKQKIIETYEDLLKLKENKNKELLQRFSEIGEKNNKQKEKLDSLTFKVLDLEYKKSNLNVELKAQFETEQKNYEEKLKAYKALLCRHEYFLDEYNSFLKTADEMTKIDVKLFDDTKTRTILIKEDLDIKLNEKLLQKSYLMSNINKLKSKIKMIKEQEKEKKWNKEKKLLACKIMGFKSKITKNQHIKNRVKNKTFKQSLSYNNIFYSN